MNFGYTERDAGAYRPPISTDDLGTSFHDQPVRTFKDISDEELLTRFAALVGRTPEYGWRAGKLLGPQAFVMPVRPDPMPSRGITSIEVSFGDRGSNKAKRQRADRVGARFDAAISVCTTKSRGVSSPVFKGRCDFYSPDRAMAKAKRLAVPQHCLTPFSSDYVAMVEQLVEGLAHPADMLVGFLCTKSQADGGGTVYHDRQMMLASREGLEQHALDEAVIFLGRDEGVTAYQLPQSVQTTSRGNPLSAKFRHQSRAVARAGYYADQWETGIFEMRLS